MKNRLLAFAAALEEYAQKSNELSARMSADIERMESRINKMREICRQ